MTDKHASKRLTVVVGYAVRWRSLNGDQELGMFSTREYAKRAAQKAGIANASAIEEVVREVL